MQLCGYDKQALEIIRGSAETWGVLAHDLAGHAATMAAFFARAGLEAEPAPTWQAYCQEGWARFQAQWEWCEAHSCYYTAWTIYCNRFRIGWCNAAYPPDVEGAA